MAPCWVLSFNVLLSIIINKTNVPADLRSAGIEYKDLLIRSNYCCFTKVRKERKAGAKAQSGLAQLKIKEVSLAVDVKQ